MYIHLSILLMDGVSRMKSICIICARSGSKGVPNKNIRILGSDPLITHSIKSALASKIFNHVIVNTDNIEIAKIAKKYGAEVPFMRPKKLAQDSTSLESVLIHGIKKLKSLRFEFDNFTIRDCTVPFIDEHDIKGAMQLFKKSNCDGVFAAIKAHPNPYFGMYELNSKGYLRISKSLKKEITRRQNAPIVYDIDGLYILNVKKFLETGRIFTEKNLPYEIPKSHGHMIDFEIDFKIAECLYNLRKQSLLNSS